MARIIVSNVVSLDGFFKGPGEELDWFNTDEEFFEYAREMLNAADALLFGRKTYQLMAAYWPATMDDDPVITHKMNSLQKIVFSKTLASVDWKNSRLAKKPLAEEARALRQQAGKDVVILGSGSIVSELTQLGLIDEYRFILNPVVLGKGHSMFKDMHERLKLKFIRAKASASGNVILYYEPVR